MAFKLRSGNKSSFKSMGSSPAKQKKEKWESYETETRESLLLKLPKEDRESLQAESLKTLKYIVSKLEESKPVNPQHSPGQSRNINSGPSKDWTTMDARERRANWDQIVSSARNKI